MVELLLLLFFIVIAFVGMMVCGSAEPMKPKKKVSFADNRQERIYTKNNIIDTIGKT